MTLHDDVQALLRDAVRKGTADGTLDRRRLLLVLGAAGLAPATAGTAAAADGQTITVANWGGPAAEAFQKVWGPGTREKLGATLAIDGTGPTAGKIRTMVEAGQTIWDVCDASVGAALMLGEKGLVEEIDYGVVGARVRPEYRYKHAVSNYVFSYVMAFDKAAFKGRQPETWKDFWNVKEFPGKRMLRGSCIGQLECALLADGVAPDKIYPIDLPRALTKIREIREHTIFWKSGSQSEDLLRRRDVVMGNVWHNRANILRQESKGTIDWTWNGGLVAPAVWLVPKNNPAGKDRAMAFIALSLEPAGQVELFRLIGMGPSNPEAAAMIPADLRRYDPSQPDNLARQMVLDEAWYGANLADAEPKYLDAISS